MNFRVLIVLGHDIVKCIFVAVQVKNSWVSEVKQIFYKRTLSLLNSLICVDSHFPKGCSKLLWVVSNLYYINTMLYLEMNTNSRENIFKRSNFKLNTAAFIIVRLYCEMH
jgi:hypothetical protein